MVIVATLYAANAAFDYDEFYFLEAAKNLATRGQYATEFDGKVRPFDPYLSTGPTVVLPVAFLYFLWEPHYLAGRLLMVTFMVVLFVLLYMVTQELHGRPAALIACLFILGVPSLGLYGLPVLGEIPGTVFFLAAIHCLVRAERLGVDAGRYVLAGLLLGFAVLTKLVFLGALLALMVVALWTWVRTRRMELFASTGMAVAVLAAWELIQFGILGGKSYVDVKQEFMTIFTAEVGLGGGRIGDVREFVGGALGVAVINVTGLRESGGPSALQLLTGAAVALFQVGRVLRRRRGHTGVHLLLGIFLGGYLLWFVLARHAPFFRLLLPAYLLLGIYFAPFVIEAVSALKARRSFTAVLGAMIAGWLVIGLGISPLVQNAQEFLQVYRSGEARSHLALVAEIARRLRTDSVIGYWGWWRAPDVAFFVPNQFLDISRRTNRDRLVTGRDFVLAMPVQKGADPESWRLAQWYCLERVLDVGGTTLCRYGDAFRSDAIIPRAPATRLDLTAQRPEEQQHLDDGFYGAEPGFRWIARRARFFLGTTAQPGRISLGVSIPEELDPNESHPVYLRVIVNDRPVSDLRLALPGPLTVVTNCIDAVESRSVLRAELNVDRSFVPAERGLSADQRELSLRVFRIEFIPDQYC